MKTKFYSYLICVLLPALIFLTHCTTVSFVSTGDINFAEESFPEKIILKNGDTLDFKTDYGTAVIVREDSLIGIRHGGEKIKIPLSDIAGGFVDRVDPTNTIFFVAGLMLAGGIAALIIFQNSFGKMRPFPK